MKIKFYYSSFIRRICLTTLCAGILGYYSFAGNNGNTSIKPGVFPETISKSEKDSVSSPVEFISCYFENASPLYWEYNPDGSVSIHFPYDKERSSPNRQFTHVHFQVQAKAGSDVTLMLHYFYNVWNSRKSAVTAREKSFYISQDGKEWTAVRAEILDANTHKLQMRMETSSMYVTGVEPYRLSDLDRFLEEIREDPLIEIRPIGKTVEGRTLEIIRVGNPKAPFSVVLRARAHPWESGGNWVTEGLIRSLLDKSENNAGYLKRYCVYILPMANKDGVARGMSRFNINGKDLNRDWGSPADPILCPENHALETWLQEMINKGKKPDLLIDLHNDSQGNLLVSHPNVNLESYLANMVKLEAMLREHTWFTEGSTHSFSYGSIGSGLVERYGIDACTYELNQLWIEGLKKVPFGEDWVLLGKQLRDVFYFYFEPVKNKKKK